MFSVRDREQKKKNDIYLRRQAIQLVAQLPECSKEAAQILALAQELLNSFMAGRASDGAVKARLGIVR